MDDLLNIAPCGVLSFKDDGTIVQVNDYLVEMLGYGSREEMVGKRVEAIFTLASRIFYQTHFFPLIRLHGKAEEIFLTLLTRGREEVPVLSNAVRREEEGVYYNHCVCIPVRQRRKYEDEILQAKRAAEEALHSNEELTRAQAKLEQHAQELDRQKSLLEQKNQEFTRLGSILAHELREPIRKISMFTDILYQENKETLTSMGSLSVERINSACMKLDQLIVTLQQFVALDSGQEPLEKVDLNEVVFRAKMQVYERTKFSAIQLRSDDLPVIEGYRSQLIMLFYNLIDNAVKFRKSDESAVIEIESSLIQHNTFRVTRGRYRYIDFVKITFSDHGIGFDSRYNDYVFEILKKVNVNTAGLGIGLPICRKVAENHHGSISADAQRGEGARFTILLPLRQFAHAPQSTESVAQL